MEVFLRSKLGNKFPQGKQDRNKSSMFDIYQTIYRRQLNENVTEEFKELRRYSNAWYDLRQNQDAKEWEDIREFSKFHDISSWYPFILYIFNETDMANVENQENWLLFLRIVESCMVRNAICYGKNSFYVKHRHLPFFEKIRKWENFDVEKFIKYLGERNQIWPNDERVFRAFRNQKETDNATQRYILYRIERLKQHNDPTVCVNMDPDQFSLEHIMPKRWEDHWWIPVSNTEERWEYSSIFRSKYKEEHPNWFDNPSVDGLIENTSNLRSVLEVAQQRKALLNSVGNLTIIGKGVNNRLGNLGFERKKAVYRGSGLHVNRELSEWDVWDVDQILERERILFGNFRTIWPHWSDLMMATTSAPVIRKNDGDKLLEQWGQVLFVTYDGVVVLENVCTEDSRVRGVVGGSNQNVSKDMILFAVRAVGSLTDPVCELGIRVRDAVRRQNLSNIAVQIEFKENSGSR